MTDTVIWKEGMQIAAIDPVDVEKIRIDWTDKLDGLTISSAAVTSPTLTVSVMNNDSQNSYLSISGSNADHGTFHQVVASIIDSDGRPLNRSFTVPIRDL